MEDWSNSSYNCTPFLHSLLTKGRFRVEGKRWHFGTLGNFLSFSFIVPVEVPIHKGGCQTYGPFLGTLNNRCRMIIGTPKGTIILTTTHKANPEESGTGEG